MPKLENASYRYVILDLDLARGAEPEPSLDVGDGQHEIRRNAVALCCQGHHLDRGALLSAVLGRAAPDHQQARREGREQDRPEAQERSKAEGARGRHG